MLFMGSPFKVGESTPRGALRRDPLPVLRRLPLVESRRGFLTRVERQRVRRLLKSAALGLAAVALGAGVARCRAAQESELQVDPRAGVAEGEVKPQRGALRETELPVKPLGNQAARLFAGELHRARRVMRPARTIAPSGKRAGRWDPRSAGGC